MAPHPMPRIRLGCTDVSTAVVNVSCLPCEHTYVNNLIFDEKGDSALCNKKKEEITSMHEETKITKKR
jgi:hypothetical protein